MNSRCFHPLISCLSVGALAIASAFLFYFLEAETNIFYRRGIGDKPWYGLFFQFPFRLVGPAILFLLMLLPACRFRLFRSPTLILILTFGLICTGFASNPFLKISPMRAQVNGHIDRATKLALFPAIEQWATNVAKVHTNSPSSILRDAEISPLVQKLSPEPNARADVLIGKSFGYEHAVLSIRFGGGGGGWGLIVSIGDGPLTNSGWPRTFRVTDKTFAFYY